MSLDSQCLFEDALHDWVKQFRFMPEEIDGRPLQTWISIPINLEIGERSPIAESKAGKPECMMLMKQGDERRAVALDSPFRRVGDGG